ncbi:MAG: NADPH-dependent F420 reductase [SAR324 cluster bacterium]|nr:NADPH-dependent F420 reductase [SAR324 cluster bacterium]MCZ6843627.1 NADPH-dependent F420 reductase [SAR324 cluster bacterium]
MAETEIGFISGTGPQGRGLAMRFAMAGVRVAVGSRQAARAQATVDELNGLAAAQVGQGNLQPIVAGENHAVVSGSRFVMLTVPFEHAADTLRGYKDSFREGSVFVDVTVPLQFGKGDVQVVVPPQGSGSRQLRGILPESVPFTGAFKTLPAHVLEDIASPMDCDTFVFGDNREAKQQLMELIRRVPSLRPLDVGGISAAATVEGMTALVIRINRKQKSQAARFRVAGIP